ncbi:hypothetical protein G9A89_015960 [Geosiphon pyriformis]|nr:hypothetical protein G9A89_015960 [Geosiphon pyriformis]
MTKAKSKKTAPDICSEISNKISTKRALFVVKAIRQNVLEAFSLLSNRDKLPLVATEATFSSLAGFLLVKVSPSVASTSIKSPKVFNNKPVNKLVFSSIAFISGAANISSSKKMVKKTKSSEKWEQLLVSAIVTLNSFVVPNEILDEISIVSSGTFRSSPVLKAKQFFPVELPIKLAYVKAVFQLVHGFLDAKSILKNNMKLFCMKFASQVFLEATFLVKFTSFVHLATLKIVKSLVISESGSLFATVVLHDVLLNVFAADIKMVLSMFDSVTHVVLKSADIWQYVVVYFEKLDSTVSALNYWSVLVNKNSVRILSLIKLAYVKAVFQLVHGFLDAKSILKNNMKLFCMKFASQVFLEATFLVKFTSFVHLATLKIVKSLVISESGSLFATVVLHDVLLNVFAADIKMVLSMFDSVTHVVLKSADIWQYVVVYFEKLDSTVSALNYWSVLVNKNSVRILSLVNQNETILFS